MSASAPGSTRNAPIGQSVSRVDGPAKVTGQAMYAAEFRPQNLTYAALVPSTVPSGRIATMDVSAALAVPGVLAVISHDNADRLAYLPRKQRPVVDPKSGDQLHVFQGPQVLFCGQPVAVVVAERPEQAHEAAALVRVTYEAADAITAMESGVARPPSRETVEAGRSGAKSRGDPDAAFAAAPVTVDATYVQPREHHNAMEPHATIASWDGDRLTLYDKSQWVGNVRAEIAHVFGMAEEKIRVISPFVGGAFGSALRTWPHVTIAALAARQVGRPVQLELTRRQLYTSVGFRPHTVQRVRLGAEADGRLTALVQDAVGQTSVYEEYAERTVDPSRAAYSCPNVRTSYRLVPMHTNSPCPMRAPGVATGVLALEMAMDELAAKLEMDPLELRLRNYAERDEDKGKPFSSKELRACYATAAGHFGWSRRSAPPRSMRDGRVLIGYGMATALYPAERLPASAVVTMYANGTVSVRTASSDMGPGTYTAMTQVAADTLGLPIEQVHFDLGDTDMPQAPVHGGSITMSSVGSAVAVACEALRGKLLELAAGDGVVAELRGADFQHRNGGLARRDDPSAYVSYTDLLERNGLEELEAAGTSKPGREEEDYSSWAFGAVFAEVRVDPDFGTVRVPRIVGAYDAGRIVNPKIARSQCIGGMVGGLGMALLEQAEWDARFGRVMNANLAEYLVPVNADAPELEAIFVPSEDYRFSPLGTKGLAEIALCGVAPAIANAVYHATGQRVRELPITPEKLIGEM